MQKAVERRLYCIGFDNLNDYYDVRLKARLALLEHYSEFAFVFGHLEDKHVVEHTFADHKINIVINLAAQAGVRYSLKNPHAYIQPNIVGFMNILEACRHYGVEHLVYASSSSVYGANTKMPFSTSDNVDHPVSLYAATKKSNELMAHTYSHLYNLPTTGLRFFTVYGLGSLICYSSLQRRSSIMSQSRCLITDKCSGISHMLMILLRDWSGNTKSSQGKPGF